MEDSAALEPGAVAETLIGLTALLWYSRMM